MKKSILILISAVFLLVFPLDAQTIKQRTYKGPKSYIKYSYYCNTDSAEGILIGIKDNDPNWTPDKLCEELSKIADLRNWMVIVPNSPYGSTGFSDNLYGVINQYQKDSLITRKICLLTIGSAAESWTFSELNKIPAVFINPINLGESIARIGDNIDLPLAVITSAGNYEGKLFSDTLRRFGGWVYYNENESPEKYFMPNHIQIFNRALSWVDSLNTILSDQASRRSVYDMSGVINEVPESVRQGSSIHLELWITVATNYSIRVEDLSGLQLWSKDMFLYKGIHYDTIPTKDLSWGVYEIVVDGENIVKRYKFMVKG